MKKIQRAVLGAAFGAIGLAACDAAPPPETAGYRPAEPETILPGETLTDLVREALADIVRDTDAYSRARRLGSLLPTLGPEGIPAVKEMLADTTLEPGAAELELLVRYWTSYQPAEAAQWAFKESNLNYRIATIASALTTWAELDPQAAVDTAWGWPTDFPALSQAVPISLIRGWYSRNDPPELRKFIYDLGMGIPRQRALTAYARAKARSEGVEALRRWAESFPDDDEEEPTFKLDVNRKAVAVMAYFDLGSALRWCETLCDGPNSKDLRNIIARVWVKSDGASALDWLGTAPESHDNLVARRINFVNWANVDRHAALAWMEAKTASEPVDPRIVRLYNVYAQILVKISPVEAIRWAERIEDPTERRDTLVEIARRWRLDDEAAAEEWLLQSPLSEEDREKARTTAPYRPQPAG